VDSEAMSSNLGQARVSVKQAAKHQPVLLEPIMKVEVITPDQYMGDVTGDLNRRRSGRYGQPRRRPGYQAKVPLIEMFGYVTQCVA